ncbi:MAG: hypothetical protein ISEC1_P1929 [Thiomicrorhabdus sp.]|nr:MAG: hypothetical protein ISEC1_P1929 [Thiomicrorhabdus sp.]
MMEGNIISGLLGAAGAYTAVWAHLGFIKWRLSAHDEQFKAHSLQIKNIELITAKCEGCN